MIQDGKGAPLGGCLVEARLGASLVRLVVFHEQRGAVKPRINIMTVAVDDLRRSLTFYRDAMGWTPWWPPPGRANSADHAAFALHGGLSLVLYPRDDLARDAHVRDPRPSSTEFSLTHAVTVKDDVDSILSRVEAAGGRLLGKPVEHPWGYAGRFMDPDGHVWEVMWNPDFKSEE